MLVALYRTNYKPRKWYMPIFSHFLDISVNNAWLLYRRDRMLLQVKEKQLCLKDFKILLSNIIYNKGRRGRPSLNNKTKMIKKPAVSRPPDEVRLDGIGHFPTYTKMQRCKFCKNGQTEVFCNKCNLNLCFTKKRNCFTLYHN